MKHKTIRPRLYIEEIPFFDNAPYYTGYLEAMKRIVKENGGFNLRMRHKWDMSNLPKVLTFSVKLNHIESVNNIEKALQKEISEWCRIDNCVNWSGPQKQKISFDYKGKNFSFSFNPDELDWWTAFKQHGFEFDVHYLEDEDKEINVYLVVDGNAQTNKTIYTQKIEKV